MGEVQGLEEQSFKCGSGKASEEMWFAKNMVDYFSWVAKEQAPSVNILFAWQFVVSLCLSKEPRRQADWWNCQED